MYLRSGFVVSRPDRRRCFESPQERPSARDGPLDSLASGHFRVTIGIALPSLVAGMATDRSERN